MTLIICISNLFIPTALSIIKEHGNKKIILYTYEEGIYRFFKEINLPNVDVFFRKAFILKRPLWNLKLRNSVLKYLEQDAIKRVYFFHNSFGKFENWLIYRLSSEASVYYVPVFNDLAFPERVNLRSWLYTQYNKFIYKNEVQPLYNGKRFIYRMTDAYFKKVGAQQLKIAIQAEFIKHIVRQNFKLNPKIRMILLTGTTVELDQVAYEEYVKKIDMLIEHIGADKLVAKAHPRYPNRFSKEQLLEEVPSYIPMNVLLYNYDILIGYTSSAVAEAAQEGLIAISLIDYFEPSSPVMREHYRAYLENHTSGQVHFPDSIEELQTLIAGK